jgi:protein-disulfide isomerase
MNRSNESTRRFFIYAVLAVAALCSASFVSAQEFKPGAFPPLEIGNPAAEFRIEIFNDLQCPASAAFFKQYKELVAKHADRVLVIFRNFPLRQHKNSLLAAKAVEAAAAQGKFLEMMTMIYDNQEALTDAGPSPEVFAGYARTLGLDMDRFSADVEGQTAIDRINFDIERAKLLGVNGTPWVLLNDRPMAYGEAQNMEATIFQNN